MLCLGFPGCNMQKQNKEKTFDTVTKLSIMKSKFGKTGDKDIYLFTLTNKHGIQVKITNYGGIITQILMPDKNGKSGDIVLGYDSLQPYIDNNPYFGAIVGRYANRIANGEFVLDGKRYFLAKNDGHNTLHGGIRGFDKVVWDFSEISDSSSAGLKLTYLSADGEEGYPGNLKVETTIVLNDNDDLSISFDALTDKATPVNICNHSYFNLNGGSSDILKHELVINSDSYTEVNDEFIPTGKLPGVQGTPMDFNTAKAVGERISQVNGGYDHNYVLRKKAGELSEAARLFDPGSGRMLTISTTQPGIQFYSGNFLNGSIKGKGGIVYRQHYGLCLETQHFPDSPNQQAFPSSILRPGASYSQKTIYRFSVIE
jgi:aldose 1-epimerase